MRVAFHAPLKSPNHPTPSGDRLMARLLMRAASLAGHDVVLASRLRTWDGTGDTQRQIRIRDLGARLAARLVRRYQEGPPEKRPEIWLTYHVYHKAPDWLGPAVTSALRIPYVIVEPSVSNRQAGGPWRIGHEATLAAIAHADAILTMSAKDHAGLRPLVTRPGYLQMFPPFIDAQPFAAALACRQRHRDELSGRAQIDPAMPWLSVAAMMRSGDKLQSYRTLARILMTLRDFDWVLLVAGDGPARCDVAESFAGLGRHRVQYLGVLEPDKLAGAYAASDLYVWPAVREAYGMSMLEAQAAGCPVVAGRYGGVPDIVIDGVTGQVVAPEDDSAFANAVRILLADPKRRMSMGHEAARHIATRHDLISASVRLGQILTRAAGR